MGKEGKPCGVRVLFLSAGAGQGEGMPGAHGVGEAVPGQSARDESPFNDLAVVPGVELRGADDGVHGPGCHHVHRGPSPRLATRRRGSG